MLLIVLLAPLVVVVVEGAFYCEEFEKLMSASSSSSSSSDLFLKCYDTFSVDCSDFRCPITLEYPTDPAETNCGHIFQFDAIRLWLTDHDRCPTCRTLLSVFAFHRSPFVKRLLLNASLIKIDSPGETPVHNRFDPLSDYIINGDELVVLPARVTLGDIIREQPLAPPPSPSPQPHIDAQPRRNWPTAIEFVTPGTSVDPNSANFDLINSLVRESNRQFVEQRSLDGRSMFFGRYIFHHRGQLPSAVVAAANHGYYVYDMTYYAPNRFVLRTITFRRDGSYHTLEAL